jgi:thiamine pyrophosphokinase
MNPSRVVMVAGGGDRLDHTLGAIGALGAAVLTSVPLVECWWGSQYLQVVHGPARVSIRTAPDTRISLLAMHGPCTGVTLSGTQWPLDRAELLPLVGHGLSNVATGPDVGLALSTGILTVFIDPPPTSRGRA